MEIPKVELHRHLEGAVRLDTVHEEGVRHGIDQPRDKAALARYVETREPFESLEALLDRFNRTQAVFKVSLSCC